MVDLDRCCRCGALLSANEGVSVLGSLSGCDEYPNCQKVAGVDSILLQRRKDYIKQLILDSIYRSADGKRITELTDETHLDNDLGADSVDIVELFMALAREFNHEVNDETMNKCETVGDVIRCFDNNKALFIGKDEVPATFTDGAQTYADALTLIKNHDWDLISFGYAFNDSVNTLHQFRKSLSEIETQNCVGLMTELKAQIQAGTRKRPFIKFHGGYLDYNKSRMHELRRQIVNNW